jgi:hypothetical protein
MEPSRLVMVVPLTRTSSQNRLTDKRVDNATEPLTSSAQSDWVYRAFI